MRIEDFISVPNEKPLDRIVFDGGFCGIFRSIAAVGDSLVVLHNEEQDYLDSNGYRECFDYYWGHYIARIAGTEVLNFSKGGLSVKEYCESFAPKRGLFNKDKACPAYIITFSVQDCINGIMEMGSISDINLENYHDHPDTFAGWFGEIILRYKEISPDAKFFVVNMPRDTINAEVMQFQDDARDLKLEICKLFSNTYMVDLLFYAPPYDEKAKEALYVDGHMNPMGCLYTAKLIMSYIDYIIRNNPTEFSHVGIEKPNVVKNWLNYVNNFGNV